MTGLDVDKHTLIEAAAIVTDGQLNVLAEGPNIIIKHPDEVLNNMEEWPKNHHAMVIFIIFPYSLVFRIIAIKRIRSKLCL